MERVARRGLAGRLLSVGVSPLDDEEERIRKRGLTTLVWLIVLLTPVWVLTYSLLGRPVSAAIPGAYLLITLPLLGYLARGGSRRLFEAIQIGLFLVLPVALQWSLGGFQHGSGVALWAFGAPLAALISWSYRAAIRVFVIFAVLIAVSALFEPTLHASSRPLPTAIQAGFWALNLLAPLTSTFLRLASFLQQRNQLAQRSEELLLNVLPTSVARRLKEGRAVADRFDEASVLFADIVSFTPFAQRTDPARLVELLGRVFSTLDDLAQHHGLEKIKTLGDGYLAVAGIAGQRAGHALAAARMGLEIHPALEQALSGEWPDLRMRVGIDSGPLVAGVIGRRRFSYDLWGDTVNTASRMAGLAEPGTVEITAATAALLGPAAVTEPAEQVEVKGKGRMTAYRLLGLTATA
jgi:class 3 adenylate cyclase